MASTIFYSWQSDTPTRTGFNFIELALAQAIGEMQADLEMEPAYRGLEVDRDTKGALGQAKIVDTIFGKIDAAHAFVGDMTAAGTRPNGDPIPNPNVLIEYGWALKSLTHDRVITVRNTAYGDPNPAKLPFDMRHVRQPIGYYLPEEATTQDIRKARATLAKALADALRGILKIPKPQPQPAAPDPRIDQTIAALNELMQGAHMGQAPALVGRPRLHVRLGPLAAMDGRRLDLKKIAEFKGQFSPGGGQGFDLDTDGTQWWCHGPILKNIPFRNPERKWLTRLVRPGHLEYQSNVGRPIEDDPHIVLIGRHIEAVTVEALDRMARIATGLGFHGPAVISVVLDGVESTELQEGPGRRLQQREIVPPLVLVPDIAVPLANSLQEAFDFMWQTWGQVSGSPSFASGEWSGLSASPGAQS